MPKNCVKKIMLIIMIVIIALKGAIRDLLLSPLCGELSPTHALKWPGHNGVQITGNT